MLLHNLIMIEKSKYIVILDALIKQGYSEDKANSMLIDLIEEQRQLDRICFEIHKMIDDELHDSEKWN